MSGEGGAKSQVVLTIGVDVGDRFSQMPDTRSGWRWRDSGGGPYSHHSSGVRPVVSVGDIISCVARSRHPLALDQPPHCRQWSETIVANPRRLRLIYQNDRKSDRVDAESLARLGRLDPRLRCTVKHRGAPAQADLALLRSRDALMRACTLLINHVRGASKAVGGRLPKCSARSFHQKVGGHIPAELAETLGPELETIARLTAQIQDLDKRIEEMAQTKYPEIGALRQVPGVGPVTATTYILTLEDPGRFPRSRAVGWGWRHRR